MEYFDLVTNIQSLITTWNDHSDYFDNKFRPKNPLEILKGSSKSRTVRTTRQAIDPQLLSVRQSVCVAGNHWPTILRVKSVVASLTLEPTPLESFHVKCRSDVSDGALLVPKVILVARHYPGKKLIDNIGDEGQLDYIFDAVCDVGADVFVVYLGLPRSIYKPMRHMVYHPRMIDVVFPDQPVLRELAEENLLVTLVEGQDEFTLMQKNVLREWLEKPVGNNHPVFKAADYLSSVELETYESPRQYTNDASFWSETEVMRRNRAKADDFEFAAATEEHPLADMGRGKKKRKVKKKLFRFRRDKDVKYKQLPADDLMCVDEEFTASANAIEMDLYGRSSNPIDALTKLSV